MSTLDYKTIAAPRRAKKVKKVKGADERFARTVEDIIAEQAADGWSYIRSDRFQVDEKKGFFSSTRTVEKTIMIFGRERAASAPAPITAAAPAQPQPAMAAPVEPAAPAPQPRTAPEPGFAAEPSGEAPAAPELGGASRG